MATTFSYEEAMTPAAEQPPPAAAPTQGRTFSYEEAMTPAPPPPERSMAESLARGVGIGARGLLQGAASLPGLVTDNLIVKPVNAALDLYDEKRAPTTSELVTGKQPGFRLQPLEQATGNVLTAAGVPQAENGWERVAQDINRGAGSAVAGLATGATLAQAASPVVAGVGQALQVAPRMQIASGAAGGGAAGVTREAGGGETAQAVAGLAGSLAPTAVPFVAGAATRGILRGGEAGRQRVEDAIKTFDDIGTTPTLGQATQGRFQQGLETMAGRIPGGAGVLAAKGKEQADAFAGQIQKLSGELAPNGANPTLAGEAIEKGVNLYKERTKNIQDRMYATLDRFIPKDAPITVGNTRQTLQELNTGIDGAENLSAWFRNEKLSSLEKSLIADLEAAAARQAPAGSRSSLMNAAPVNLDTATLPYESIKKMRTLVGREVGEANFTSDVSRDKLSALYAALSRDLGVAVDAAGPSATNAWQRANAFTAAQMQRLDQLGRIVNRETPERIFSAAMSGTNEGATTVNRVMSSLPQEYRREVAGAVLQRMGRAVNSKQNELGDAFSSETFLSNLANMKPEAQAALFGATGMENLQQRIRNMAGIAARRRESGQVFANPSGTAQGLAQLGTAAAIGGGAVGALTTGGIGPLVSAVGVPLGARVVAKTLASPKTARMAATNAELSPAFTPATVAAAARESDFEARKRANLARIRAALQQRP